MGDAASAINQRYQFLVPSPRYQNSLSAAPTKQSSLLWKTALMKGWAGLIELMDIYAPRLKNLFKMGLDYSLDYVDKLRDGLRHYLSNISPEKLQDMELKILYAIGNVFDKSFLSSIIQYILQRIINY